MRALLRDPAVRIVSSTRHRERLLPRRRRAGSISAHPDIVRDLADPAHPVSIVGWLALGLRDRREAGLPAFTPLCCDNHGLERPASSAPRCWIMPSASIRISPTGSRAKPSSPNAMVDSITPATDDAAAGAGPRGRVSTTRSRSAARPMRPGSSRTCSPADSPDLASARRRCWPRMSAPGRKRSFRILNGAHSTLAYLGLLIGHETVADAMGDAALAGFVERLIRDDIIPSLEPFAARSGHLFARDPRALPQPGDRPQARPDRLGRLAEAPVPPARHDRRGAVPPGAASRASPFRSPPGSCSSSGAPRPGSTSSIRSAHGCAEIGRGGDRVRGLLAVRQVFPERLAADADLHRRGRECRGADAAGAGRARCSRRR